MNLTSLILFVMIIICIILLPGALIPNYHQAKVAKESTGTGRQKTEL